MASFCHLRALTRPAHQIPLPHTTTRSYSLPQPRIPPRFTPPPARRHFEFAPLAQPPTPPRHGPQRRPTNRQIPFSHVYVLDPGTNARSAAKQPLEAILAGLDSAKGSERRVVELVTASPDPIVRLTTRNEIEARYREMKRALKKGEKVGEEPKEVQLTWGVGKADLEHKLRKARRDLDKGYRVAVTISVKYSCRPSSRQELIAFGDGIARTLGEVGHEWKERKVTDRLMVLSFQKTDGQDDGS